MFILRIIIKKISKKFSVRSSLLNELKLIFRVRSSIPNAISINILSDKYSVNALFFKPQPPKSTTLSLFEWCKLSSS